MRMRPWLATIAGLSLVLSSFLLRSPAASAAASVQVFLDGRRLALDPPAVIVDDRTLVPVRGVFDAMGAAVNWNAAARTVEVSWGERYVRIGIDRRLAYLDRDYQRFAILDVPARLIGDRTYVPARFVSTAMGVNISWDGARRAVLIKTDGPPVWIPSPVTINTLTPGQVIGGPTPLGVTGMTGSSVRFHLLDPLTGSGPIIAAGTDPQASYTFTPDPAFAGKRLLVAAVIDTSNVARYSDPVPVTVAPDTSVRVTGVDRGGLIEGPIALGSETRFVATHVAFRLQDPATGSVEELGTAGPGDQLTWYPQIGHNGNRLIQAAAYDRNGKPYESEAIPVTVRTGERTKFYGIENGAVLTRPVSLRVVANYPIESVNYVLDGYVLGSGASLSWSFGPEANGSHTLQVEVTGKDGVVRSLAPVTFTVNTTPQVWLSGVGPNQVVSGPATLNATSNVKLSSVKYILVDAASGRVEHLGQTNEGETFTWTPTAAQAGDRTLFAVGQDTTGQEIPSDKINIRVFLGKVYGPLPVVPKAEFKDLAVRLALPTYRETGMSAALQVAQAILETGWGQYVPVDKYTGQLSYNLFGIKGTGPAGSVTSNTWEEYNGIAYRIDAPFRAYNNVDESWRDHKDLLLLRPWYAPFRAVMADPVLGAWALRKSGYATDSQYPLKLINIMKQNDLFRLDEVQF